MKSTTQKIKAEATQETSKLCAAIGSLIRKERLKRNLSVRKLASISGSSSSLISDLETGNHLPVMETLIKLAMVLEIPLNKLFGISESFESPNTAEDNLRNLLFMMNLKRGCVEEIVRFVKFKLHENK